MNPRRVIVPLAAAALLGGCTHGSASSTHLATYRGDGITFAYPASWRHRHRGIYTTMSSPVVDLSTQPTRNPCTRHSCWFPVRHLRPGAVVVMWEESAGLIDPSHPPAVGVHVHVLPHSCRPLGGGEELTAQVVLRGGRIYEAAACTRGPNVAAHEREVRAMLASPAPAN